MGVLALGDRRHRAGLGRREPSPRNRRHRRPDRDTLLLRPHADSVPADRQARTAATVAEQHRPGGGCWWGAAQWGRGANGEALNMRQHAFAAWALAAVLLA